MEQFHIPIMADSLLSSIANFHTTKIIVTDPSKFPFNGSIPESMYACVSRESKVIQEYKKLPSSGPRELTPEMIRSIEDGDRLAKRGKKVDPKKGNKERPSSKAATPKKWKQEKAAPSQPKSKKVKKVVKNPRSPSIIDSDYVPTGHLPVHPPSESEIETESASSYDEISVRGGTPPPFPTN